MRLHEMLDGIVVQAVQGDSGIEITSITHDSRRVSPHGLFCCVPGMLHDGHDHVAEAVQAGAVALVVQHVVDLPVAQVLVADVRAVMGDLASAFYGNPSGVVQVLGVTGTNGKTTTTHLLESIANAAGRRVGVIGTLGTRIDGVTLPTERTTPEAPDLQALFARMRDSDVDLAVMEVSSHALALHRVSGTHFAAACFTNLSHEHLDFHHTVEEYFAVKATLFHADRTSAGVSNLDDPYGRRLVELARAAGLEMLTFGIDAVDAELRAEELTFTVDGSRFRLRFRGEDLGFARLVLPGEFNVSNALAAGATAIMAGLPVQAVVEGLSAPVHVPGRFERIGIKDDVLQVFVDYAHTPDALEQVLRAARKLAADKGGRVMVVFGCGGDRDRGKRPLMGEVAGLYADVVWVTSDNPRSEDPAAIIAEILPGLRGVEAKTNVEPDRSTAIHDALRTARPNDVVIIAGKGHEQGQTIGDVTVDFDDRVVAREELERLRCG